MQAPKTDESAPQNTAENPGLAHETAMVANDQPQTEFRKWISKVIGFNWAGDHGVHVIFEETKPTPPGVTPLVIFVDLSGSMNDHVRELKTILASWLLKSNAEGLQVPKLEGATGMVHAVQKHLDLLKTCDCVVITDGVENQVAETLVVGHNPNGSEIQVNMGECRQRSGGAKGEYLIHVASYLMFVCGAQLYFVGLGAEAEPMASAMIKRRNCHVAIVRKGSNAAEANKTVLELSDMGEQTRKNPEREPQTQMLRVELSKEALEALDAMQAADVRLIEQTTARIGVIGHKALDMPWDAEAVRKAIVDVEKEMVQEFPRVLSDDHLTKLARSHMLWYAMACIGNDDGLVATIISAKVLTGKRLLSPPDPGLIETPGWNTYLNTTLQRWATAGLLVSKGKSKQGEPGVEVPHMGSYVTVNSPSTAKYAAAKLLTADVIRAAVEGWSVPLDKLEKVPLEKVGAKKQKVRA